MPPGVISGLPLAFLGSSSPHHTKKIRMQVFRHFQRNFYKLVRSERHQKDGNGSNFNTGQNVMAKKGSFKDGYFPPSCIFKIAFILWSGLSINLFLFFGVNIGFLLCIGLANFGSPPGRFSKIICQYFIGRVLPLLACDIHFLYIPKYRSNCAVLIAVSFTTWSICSGVGAFKYL